MNTPKEHGEASGFAPKLGDAIGDELKEAANPHEEPGERRARKRSEKQGQRLGNARARARELALAHDPRATLAAVGRAIEKQYAKNPTLTLAVALGIGVIIGGGLSMKLGRMAISAATRHTLRELLKAGS